MLDAIILLLGLAIVLVPRFQKLEKTPIKGGSSELRRGDIVVLQCQTTFVRYQV